MFCTSNFSRSSRTNQIEDLQNSNVLGELPSLIRQWAQTIESLQKSCDQVERELDALKNCSQ